MFLGHRLLDYGNYHGHIPKEKRLSLKATINYDSSLVRVGLGSLSFSVFNLAPGKSFFQNKPECIFLEEMSCVVNHRALLFDLVFLLSVGDLRIKICLL